MKTLTKTALLAAGMALASQAVHAAPDDLILGFNTTGGANDYILDLGSASSILGGADLSGAINMTTFNSTFAGGPSGVNVGVVGGNSGTGTKDVYETGTSSTVAPTTVTAGSFISTAGAAANAMTTFGVVSSSLNNSWTTQVGTDPSDTSSGVFVSALQSNPMSTIAGSSIVEYLWRNTRGSGTSVGGWVYDGYFTLNFTSPTTETLTFTPVPEPTTYGLLAGAGLLALCFRRQLSRQ